ncbi:LolA family protein [Natronobacterium gregoryi]|uniref:Outer membrane lipoprotein-sorting protein n=2 Tax=Natronobacterium gregoryi TaxID=44930 RepID=L0ALF4_NATGS|nr:hypothetical protein [Natronobacterium gregoryi]AFZ74723.1 hypothetical protein Natgr_3610 [Natronobacterium gregoryi SP2]ELY73470.1 hypothetical protein C490_01355 [Natronobacterium gregoryi SP2]PLK20967.1 hypothetical protein CYV19_06815 [Natronobacterium gregoryi SP2]SFJ04047.1 Outer membrane lipoprotein-sorting protein [Natronobacterium gregoryi]
MSPTADRRVALLTILIGVTILAAGCVAVPTADDSAAVLEDRIADAEPPNEIDATLEVREEVDGETTTTTDDIQFRADGVSRIETADGLLIVTDGDQRWHHDRETERVQRFDVDPGTKPFLEGLYDQQAAYVERYDIDEIEETTFEGHEVYRVVFDPPPAETINRSVSVLVGETEYVVPLERTDGVDDQAVETVEVWYDDEQFFPIKHRVEGAGVELETTYRDVTFEPGFVADRFDVDAPMEDGSDENAEDVVEVVFPELSQHETVAGVDEAVPFSVAEPPVETLPDALALDAATSYEFPDEERTQASLSYRANGETVIVKTSDGPRTVAVGGDDVQIGDGAGTIADTPQGAELEWACDDDLYYSVFVSDGVGDDRALALEIAEAIGCDPTANR